MNLLGIMDENIQASVVNCEDKFLTNLVENKSNPSSILVLYKECKHLAKEEERHTHHVGEARHVHSYRHLAFR